MKVHRGKILLVEDDPNLGFVVKDNLIEAGFDVDLKKDGVSGFQGFFKNKYDVALLDVMLPKKDGIALAKDIRKVSEDTPIIFLTAKSLPVDKIEGFRAGADDYITKPFDMEELILRIEAILKRSKAFNKSFLNKDSFELGLMKFNYKNHELIEGDNSRSLTKKEAELLRLLCIHEGEVLERAVALDLVWGNDDYFLGRSMDVFISKLRKYLSFDPHVQIVNVHGIGFKLIVNQD